VPSGAQAMRWVPLSSRITAHFSPGPQPVCATTSQVEAATPGEDAVEVRVAHVPTPVSPATVQAWGEGQEPGSAGSQACRQVPLTQAVPPTQSSTPAKEPQRPPTGTVPSGAQAMRWVPLSSRITAHFSPGPQPVCATASHVDAAALVPV
jgi:hypothetical protein